MAGPRLRAAFALEKIYDGIYIKDALQFDGLSPKDARLMEQIVYGCVRHRSYLDSIVNRYVRNHKRLETMIRCILQIGLYQIRFLDRVPAHAAVDEAVRSAKKIANVGAAGLVNGVLRAILREKEKAFRIVEKDPVRRLSIQYSFPEEWVRHFQPILKEETEAFFRALSKPAPLTVRPVGIDRDTLAHMLEAVGYSSKPSPASDIALDIADPWGLFSGDAFRSGAFYVQDAASMHVVELFTPDRDARALDLCAAPGGKSFQMAEIFASVDAFDVSPARLAIMNENIERLQIQNVHTQVNNALKPVRDTSYDRILLDAPCSGFGLIRRKPEIKWRVRTEDLKDLARVQRKMLENAYGALSRGGELVYSTCTVTLEENEGVLQSFLSDHPECTLKGGGERFWPHKRHTDGFSMACIVRKE